MNNSSTAEAILSAIASCLPHDDLKISLHEPIFEGNESEYVNECLNSGWISYLSMYVTKFEKQLAEFTGVREAIAMVNGTVALHLALKLVGVDGESEVILPALTFIATANAVSYCNAYPHFVDSSYETLGLDPVKLRVHLDKVAYRQGGKTVNKSTGRRIAAIVAMHTYGHPVDMDPLVELAKDFDIPLVEDAAESLGSYYHGTHTGNWGKCSILSFNGNKVVTTGGGGALLTNDLELAKLARHLSTTAKVPHPWLFDHDMVGFNYRMPGINAAIGCGQMEQLYGRIQKKRLLKDAYSKAFNGVAGAEIFSEAPFATSNYWLNVLLLSSEHADLRDAILESAHKRGILLRPAWTLLHKLPMFVSCPRGDLSVSEDLERRIINLPSSSQLAPLPVATATQ